MNKRLQDISDLEAQRIQENREVVEVMKEIQMERNIEYHSKPFDHLTTKTLELSLKRRELIKNTDFCYLNLL
ncbi:hypothetical protein Hanom_Chr01g00064631 [Helianthus anomalus]